MSAKDIYEIGGVRVCMTPAAAERWNYGAASPRDLAVSLVSVPGPAGTSRTITLRRATNATLEPACAAQLRYASANPIKEAT